METVVEKEALGLDCVHLVTVTKIKKNNADVSNSLRTSLIYSMSKQLLLKWFQ